MIQVIKRDGRECPYDISKIEYAVLRALEETGEAGRAEEAAKEVAAHVDGTVRGKGADMEVEELQELILSALSECRLYETRDAYARYRDERTRRREAGAEMIKGIRRKISAASPENQNANVDENSFGGRMGEASRVLFKHLAREYMSEAAWEAHTSGLIYIHDLDSYVSGMPNCRTIPFDRLLAEGVKVPRNGDLRPAGSVSSALQLIAVIFQLQSLEQFGGVSAGHIDWTLVPYVRKSFHKNMRTVKKIRGEEWECPVTPEAVSVESYDTDGDPAAKMALEMTENELAQAVEAFYHNLNTLQSRSGNQLPFTSINYGTCTEPEGRMVTRALLEGSLAGIGSKHLTPIFPCGVFQMKEGVNRREGDPNYDLFRLALKSTAERVYPNYANCDWSGNYGYEEGCPETYFSTMGCRTANGYDINGLGQLKDGRGNVCPVTIILPELAMRVGGDPVAFMEELPMTIDLAADMLVERYRHICAQPVSAAPFTFQNRTIAGYVEGEGAESGHKHGTLTVGQLGLAEALRILVGEDHTAPRGMELAHRIEATFRDRCAAMKKERSLNFGVYYTPAENLCHTALKQFRNKWGEIPGVSDKEFFTNSMHVPVWHDMDAFRKIDIESELTGYSSAGCITYVELDAACRDNLDAVEALVGHAMDKDIPYFAINTPHDMCGGCGKTGEFGETCPACGSDDIRRLRRVTGYLTADYKTSFNAGKRQEVELRRRHS